MTAAVRPDLSVVIPAWNEAGHLASTLVQLRDALAHRPGSFEIIVVDDGSHDGTWEVARGLHDERVRALRLTRNLGKGAAVRQGVLRSRGRRVLITDADQSTPIDQLARLEEASIRAPIVVGSRRAPGARLDPPQPLHRRVMGRIFTLVTHLAGVRGIADTQCGFKLLDGVFARRLFRRVITAGFAFDVELLWLAQRLGCDVCEVGVVWCNDPDSRVRPMRDAPEMLREIVQFRMHHRHLGRERPLPRAALGLGRR